MTEQNHLNDRQLGMLLRSEVDECVDEIAEHLESCRRCRRALESMAADNELWAKAATMTSDACSSKRATPASSGRPSALDGRALRTENASIIGRCSTERLLEAPSHPEMMGRIGDYDVEREIGRGGMGVVFKAFDRELNRPVAIKLLLPHLADSGPARKRFAREAQAAAAVLHPNVVPIYGVNASGRTPYLVMPFVAGTSLQGLIDEHGPLDETEVVRMTLQVSAGLIEAHAQGLVHRDVKPSNILVESDVSRVLVTDFGLARAVDDASATQSGCFVGTPNYMSPEQANGRNVDGRSDLFSLGCVMYFMCTGRMPFRADSALSVLNRIAHDQHTPVRQVNSDISQTVCDVIDKLLQKLPEDRFQTARDLHEILQQQLAHLHQPDVNPSPFIPPIATVRSSSVHPSLSLWSLALGAFLSLAVLGGLDWMSGGLWSGTETAVVSANDDALRPYENGEQLPVFGSTPVFETKIARTYRVRPGGCLALDADQGVVEVTTSRKNEVKLEVLTRIAAVDRAEAEKIGARHELNFSAEEQNVTVRAALDADFEPKSGPSPFRAVFFRVTVPRRYNLKLSTQTGDLSIENELEGKIHAETRHGDISMAKVIGSVDANTSRGSVTTGDIDGWAELFTKRGRITTGKVSAGVSAQTGRGDISVALSKQPDRDSSLSSSRGSIIVRLSKSLDLNIDANFTEGRVNTPFSEDDIVRESGVRAGDKNRWSGIRLPLNDGGPELSVSAGRGDITFEYLDEE